MNNSDRSRLADLLSAIDSQTKLHDRNLDYLRIQQTLATTRKAIMAIASEDEYGEFFHILLELADNR